MQVKTCPWCKSTPVLFKHLGRWAIECKWDGKTIGHTTRVEAKVKQKAISLWNAQPRKR